jgi:hypothetical protein
VEIGVETERWCQLEGQQVVDAPLYESEKSRGG